MKKLEKVFPFLIMPVFTPVYIILDKLILVDIFGCGCVPEVQSNMLNISFNSNDLRLTVFLILAAAMSAWGFFISKRFQNSLVKVFYCVLVFAWNLLLALWVVKTFMWL